MLRINVLILFSCLLCQAQTGDDFEEYLTDLSSRFDIVQICADSLPAEGFILLDTREEDEFSISRIGNAIHAGYDDFELSMLDMVPRDSEIIVYCSVGYRSSKIALELIDHGFKNVKNLYGGIFKWANEGRPLYTDSTQTAKIHTYNRHWGRFIVNPALIKIH